MMSITTTTTTAVALAILPLVQADECKPISEIYADGDQLCETMWGDAFEAVDDSDEAFTMWFLEPENPNDDVSKKLGLSGANETCYLDDYLHKKKPGPENLGECDAFNGNACCNSTLVTDKESLLANYGPTYRWDRCGTLSPKCEQFFVQEACFYECDANNGYYRKFVEADMPKVVDAPDNTGRMAYIAKCNPRDETAWSGTEGGTVESVDGKKFLDTIESRTLCGVNPKKNKTIEHNRWELYKMPIKRSYCNKWYQACKNDFFCGAGNFFDCAQIKPKKPKQQVEVEVFSLSPGGLAGIIIAAVLVAIFGVIIAVLVVKERMGKPVFQKLPEMDEPEKGAEIEFEQHESSISTRADISLKL